MTEAIEKAQVSARIAGNAPLIYWGEGRMIAKQFTVGDAAQRLKERPVGVACFLELLADMHGGEAVQFFECVFDRMDEASVEAIRRAVL